MDLKNDRLNAKNWFISLMILIFLNKNKFIKIIKLIKPF